MTRRVRNVLATLLGIGVVAVGALVLLAFGPSRSAQALPSCTVTWTGTAGDGLWETAGNWNTDALPGPTDVVCINETTTTVTYSGPDTLVLAVRSSAPLTIASGELGLTGTTDASSVAGLTISGGSLGDTSNDQASLTDTGAFSWTSGSIQAPTTQTIQPVLSVTSTTNIASINGGYSDNNWNLDFSGSLSFSSANLYTYNGGSFTVAGVATFADGSALYDQGQSGPFTVTSTGTLTKAATSGTANEHLPLDVLAGGTVSVPGGTLSTGNGTPVGTVDGHFSAAAGATLGLDGDNTGTSGASSGAGTVVFSGTNSLGAPLGVANATVASGTTTATVAVDMAGTLDIQSGEFATVASGGVVGGFALSSGSLGDQTNDQGSFTDTGTFSWTGGSIEAPNAQSSQPVLTDTSTTDTAVIDGGYQNNNWNVTFDSPLSYGSSYLYCYYGGSFTEAGVATFADGSTLNDQGQGGVFTVTSTGTLTKAGTSGTATVGLPVVNDGTVAAGGGTLVLDALTNTGTLNLGTGVVVVEGNSYTPAAGSTTEVTIGGTAAGISYGQLQLSGGITASGTLDVTTAVGFTPTSGETFAIVASTGTSTGTFSPVDQALLPGGLAYTQTGSAAGVTLTVGTAISPTTLPDATDETAYSAQLSVLGGTAPFTWSVSAGTLPAGLTLAPSTGLLSGTPTTIATTHFTIEVADSSHPVATATQAYTFNVVSPGPPTVTAVIPSAGPTTGGTGVDISGTLFTGATAVRFGSTEATSFTVMGPDEIDAVSPSGTVGNVDITVTAPGGTSATSSADVFAYVAVTTADPYHSLPPARICDTRTGGTKVGCAAASGPLGPGSTLTVTAEGNGGVPASGVTTVVVNITVANTTAQSHLTVYPANQPEPTASNLNWVAGQTVPNLVQVGLSPSGTFDLSNLNGDTDVIVDVEGYFAPPAATGEGLYNALASPARICDTRTGNPSGLTGTALTQCEGLAPAPGTSLAVQVTGLGGVPSTGVGAVVLNVTAIGATASGHLTVYPAGGAAPTASNVNYTAGLNVANRVIVPVSATGAVDVFSFAGTPQIAVDVAGWYTDASNAAATGTIYTPASSPTRVCDTRTGLDYTTQCTGDTLGAGTVLPVVVAGELGIPSDAKAVVLNVTATDTTGHSHLTVYPFGQPLPTVSDLNWAPGKTVPNLVVATVGTGGELNLENFADTTDVIVDVVGWYS